MSEKKNILDGIYCRLDIKQKINEFIQNETKRWKKNLNMERASVSNRQLQVV